jgi:transposase-like protein
MRGKQIKPELRSQIIAESMKAGCVVANLAKQYGISKDTIYGWRAKYSNSASTSPTPQHKTGSYSNANDRFIELAVNDVRQLANLQEASLKFNDFSLVIQGQIKSSTLISIVKILEQTC